jgi:hypothetical protein
MSASEKRISRKYNSAKMKIKHHRMMRKGIGSASGQHA